jgi:cyclopropane-fatty-acyl-phospholipid synthase
VEEIAGLAGVQLNGPRPWDMQVHDERFFERALEGSIGLGESYMDGWWDAPSLDEFFARIRSADLYKKVVGLGTLALVLKTRLLNLQDQSRARQVDSIFPRV